MSEADSAAHYEPKATVQHASKIALQSAGVGFAMSAIQNALGKHSHGAMGVLTRTGGTIGFFAAMGGTFAFTEYYVANLREKDDALNGAIGGCAAGFLAGVRSRSLPLAVGGCALLGATTGAIGFTGSLAGEGAESKEERRKKFFKHSPPPLIDASAAE